MLADAPNPLTPTKLATRHRPLRWVAVLWAFACLFVPPSAWSAGWSATVCVEKAGVVATGTASNTLVAVDMRDGRVLWSRPQPEAASAKLLSYEDRLLLVDPEGTVTALEARTGAKAWQLPKLGTPRGAPQMMGNMLLLRVQVRDLTVESLEDLVRNLADMLLLRMETHDHDFLEAIDMDRGEALWKASGRVLALWPAEGAGVLALFQEQTATPHPDFSDTSTLAVRCLDLATGEARWASPIIPGLLKGQPVEVPRELLVLASVATRTSPPASTDAQGTAVSRTVTRITALRVADGSPAWERELPDAEVAQFSLTPQGLLVQRRDGLIQAYGMLLGTLAWEKTLDSLDLPGTSAPPASTATPAAPTTGVTDVRVGGLGPGFVYVLAHVDGHVELISLESAGGREGGRLKLVGGVTAGPWALREALPPGDSGSQAVRSPGMTVVLMDVLAPPPAKTDGKPSKADPVHRLVALDPETLAQRWTYDLSEPLEDAPQVSPHPERTLVLRQGESIVRLDLASGKVVAKAAVTGDIDSEPILVGGDAIVGCKDGKLRLYDMATGHVGWSISTKPWFAKQKLPNLIFVLVLSVLIVAFIYLAHGGKRLFIRRIAGLAALDEAVGRAAEMGRPVLFTTGMYDVDDNQTLSALSILGHVARRAAEYETRIVVPCRWAVAMTSADEVVKTSFLKAGRPDAYRSDDVRYMSEDQFGYVAGVDGIMLRERPAANFYMGQFFGESLILAETGHTTGAIQIAGTAATAQMPFFVAACDYTLLGEELFAASAYLSEDPLEVGSLKGQDVAKFLIMTLIIVCSLLHPLFPWMRTWLSS